MQRRQELRGKGPRAARAAVWACLPILASCALAGYPAPPPPAPVEAPGPAGSPGRSVPIAMDPPPVASSPPPVVSAPARPPISYEVYGERYDVLADAGGYRQVGVASWYGNAFAGRPTSSGELYDPEGLTAAHRTLPLSTWVEVTNLENGKKVVLRVNDRGPFRRTEERIIDVSFGAAKLLGLVGPGVARVEVRALPPDAGGSLRRPAG